MDKRLLWKRVLLECARLQKGSCVVVDGFREQLDELEMLASECYVQGIYPILKLSLSPQSLEYVAEMKAPENLEARHLLSLIEGIDAWISVFGWQSEESKGKPRMYPPEYQPSGKVFEKMGRKKVKFIMVTLPPPEGHPLAGVVRKAFECDYNKMRLLGRKLKDALKDSEDVHIETEFGTNLHFYIKKAREYRYGSGGLEDVSLRFEQGHLVDWKASKGSILIDEFLERTKGTSDMFCEVCLGINEMVDSYVGLVNIDELRYGAADIAIGHNRPFGGSRTIPPIHWHFSLGKVSLSVEGKNLIRNGEIVSFLVK